MNDIRELVRTHHPRLAPWELRAFLAEKIALADAEISKRQAELDGLVARREELQNHYDNCCLRDAPVRRLPSEILVEIFALHSAAYFLDEIFDESAFERLAQLPLLIVSQVCARWHAIAIGTPSLWTNISLLGFLWATPTSTEKAITLLQSALERGGNYALNVTLIADLDSDLGMPESAFTLFAAHSQRWRAADFNCPLTDIQRFSALSLPQLETLRIDSFGDLGPDMDVSFESVPRLRSLSIGDTDSPQTFTPQFDRLSDIAYEMLRADDIAHVISFLPDFSRRQHFRLHIDLDPENLYESTYDRVVLRISPTSSDISILTIEIDGQFNREHCRQVLAQITSKLTLPHLHTLAFHSVEHRRFPLFWSQSRFLGLATRSSFHLHLRMLSLSDLCITESQLLECLALLPVLERLGIADHARIGGCGKDLVLLTDSLLHALTASNSEYSGTALVPHLTHLHLRTRLQFSDATYLAFVRVRRPFTSEIFVMPEAERDWLLLHSQLQAQEGLVSTVWAL
ncbi:hypothetical protein C8R43DRAFT_1020082 [Mycena crocata]|nr:hypothetical protein C8R43DRAFT_1020082 [Mycena crocata]